VPSLEKAVDLTAGEDIKHPMTQGTDSIVIVAAEEQQEVTAVLQSPLPVSMVHVEVVAIKPVSGDNEINASDHPLVFIYFNF
jgi:predicted N-acetyltransferase YhbS